MRTGQEKLDRTDDPVRMYLREMGSVELLSREGEIAIAKRIEAGRNTMIAGLCESPLTFQAITIWRDELLSKTFCCAMLSILRRPLATRWAKKAKGATPRRASCGRRPEAERRKARAGRRRQPDCRTTMKTMTKMKQANMSLAAMEAALKPQVLETLDSYRPRLCEVGRNAGQHVFRQL